MGNYIPRQADLGNMAFNYFQRGQDWVEGANCLEQSPIDIVPEETEPNDKTMKMELFFTDHDLLGLKVIDTGNSLQVNGPFSKLLATDVEGDVYEYEAVQFHFHAPAEHSICGGHYDLEMHIVHQITPRCVKKGGVKRDLAVVGIFFEVDEDPNAKPHPFIEALNLHDLHLDVTLNMNELFKKDLQNYETYYAYKGSLTVPPCSANANWYVIEKPLMITKHQLEHFDLRWKDNPDYAGGHGNNRPVQPLNGRVVMQSKNCCIMSRSQESVRQFLLEEKLLGSPLASKLQTERDIVFEALNLDQSHAMDHIHGFVDGHSIKHPDSHGHHDHSHTNHVSHGGH